MDKYRSRIGKTEEDCADATADGPCERFHQGDRGADAGMCDRGSSIKEGLTHREVQF
jgi:hypothetical protein